MMNDGESSSADLTTAPADDHRHHSTLHYINYILMTCRPAECPHCRMETGDVPSGLEANDRQSLASSRSDLEIQLALKFWLSEQSSLSKYQILLSLRARSVLGRLATDRILALLFSATGKPFRESRHRTELANGEVGRLQYRRP
jgi:hypothetical protein